jgi:hypothetical protein
MFSIGEGTCKPVHCAVDHIQETERSTLLTRRSTPPLATMTVVRLCPVRIVCCALCCPALAQCAGSFIGTCCHSRRCPSPLPHSTLLPESVWPFPISPSLLFALNVSVARARSFPRCGDPGRLRISVWCFHISVVFPTCIQISELLLLLRVLDVFQGGHSYLRASPFFARSTPCFAPASISQSFFFAFSQRSIARSDEL